MSRVTPLLVLCAVLAVSCRETDGTGGAEAHRFFLPTGEEPRNTVRPRIEIDRDGRIHALYPAYAIGDAFYATCAADCRRPEDVSVVVLGTEGTVHDAMFALDDAGRPHVLLATYGDVYYGRCTGDCASPAGWELDVILSHGGDLEISGEAFALTPDGEPRFVVHTYRGFLGGSSTPGTFYAACDTGCDRPEAWTTTRISDQVWQESTLRFTADGHPRLAAVVLTDDAEIAAYAECNGACTDEDDWTGVGLVPAYSDRWIAEIDPSIGMALTATGGARIAVLGASADGVPNLTWLECDASCTSEASWRGVLMTASDQLGTGIDVAVDATGASHFVYTETGNIRHARCAATDCTTSDAPWAFTPVELSSDMKPDEVIPYPGCTVAAWFLGQPSLAVGTDGLPRVVYRAEDISGGWSHDPLEPECVAGRDMTLVRFAWLTSPSRP